MKKILLIFLIIITAIPGYCADQLEITLGGKVDVQLGYAKQKDLFKYRYHYDDDDILEVPIAKRSSYALVNNDTKIELNLNAKSDKGFKYGGKIRFNADTSVDAASNDDVITDRTMIFIESNAGRLEGGAYNSASDRMRVSAVSIAKASGGIDGSFSKWFGKGKRISSTNKPSGKFSQRYIVNPELPIDCDCISFTNKVTYFSPKLNGFQIGISYSPDTAIHGTVAKYQAVTRNTGKGFNNLIDYGVIYENNFKDLQIKLGLTGEFAKAKKKLITDVDIVNRKNLNAWEIGSILTYKEFSIAGSFSDWGKSSTPVTKFNGKKYGAKFWTAGAAYTTKKFGTSLTYFSSKRANVFTAQAPVLAIDQDDKHNKLEYLILSTEYNLAKGLLPYIELGLFKAKDSKVESNKGYIFLSGLKLSF